LTRQDVKIEVLQSKMNGPPQRAFNNAVLSKIRHFELSKININSFLKTGKSIEATNRQYFAKSQMEF